MLNDSKHYLKDVLLINAFHNIVTEPTRGHALLDPILVPLEHSILDKGVLELPALISDHRAPFITIPFDYPVSSSYKRLVWLYTRGNYQELNEKINSYDWNFINDAPMNEVAERFEGVFLSLANECIPSKEVTMLHIKGRLPVLLCAVKTVEGDFRFRWTTTPNVGQTHKENPNLVRILYMVCTLNDIYKQYNKLHEH